MAKLILSLLGAPQFSSASFLPILVKGCMNCKGDLGLEEVGIDLIAYDTDVEGMKDVEVD